MQVHSVFIEELSQVVKILAAETKQEIQDSLATLDPNLSELTYKSWVLDGFIVSVTTLFNSLVEFSKGDGSILTKYKEVLYRRVLKLNQLLDPKNIYVNSSNGLTLNKEKIRLTELPTWSVKEDTSNFKVFNTAIYEVAVENANSQDHMLEVEPWDEIDPGISVCVRVYNKESKPQLLYGLDLQTEDDLKYCIVVICIDNFTQLLDYLARNKYTNELSIDKVVKSLYYLATKYNPFLQVKLKDIQKIKNNYKLTREGTKTDRGEVSKATKQSRRLLSDVPKKEILNLEETIKESIFGQEDAIHGVCNAVKRAYVGIKNPKAPIGAFFFYGGTSTGKTELAKMIAKHLTKSNTGLLKVPCNSLLSSHNIHTLIGSPPGYVGYEEKGLLERGLDTGLFKVILFDEVEKAHPKLFDLVLEMLEEGEILLANGERLDMSQCLLLFTSNMGQTEARKAINTAGFKSGKDLSKEQEALQASLYEKNLKEDLKPEFLARLNGFYYFKPLSEESLLRTATAYLKTSFSLLKNSTVEYNLDELGAWVITQCKNDSQKFHARDVRRVIDLKVIKELGDFLISRESSTSTTKKAITITIKEKSLAFS